MFLRIQISLDSFQIIEHFHNILKTLSSKHMKKMCNINIICWHENMKKKTLATVFMAPICVNIPIPNMCLSY
jgi:hypothetical protein